MRHLKLAVFEKLDPIICAYSLKSAREGEAVRQRLAEELYALWKEFNLPFPARVESHDYWYFVHIFSQNKHIYSDGKRYALSFTRFQECWVEPFSEASIEMSSDILDTLFRVAQNKTNSLIDLLDISRPTRHLSRRDSDLLLAIAGGETLSTLGFSPQKYRLMHIPLEIYLQGINLRLWGNLPLYTHLDGYRLRDDGVIASLFAGNFFSKTLPCIDSYFMKFRSKHLIARYIILSKIEMPTRHHEY
jgi:hypothetical protein